MSTNLKQKHEAVRMMLEIHTGDIVSVREDGEFWRFDFQHILDQAPFGTKSIHKDTLANMDWSMATLLIMNTDFPQAPEKPQRPHRRYQMTLSIGADSMEELRRSLDQWVFEMERCGEIQEPTYGGASGSPTAGYSYEIQFDSEMTPERYHEELKAYLEAEK